MDALDELIAARAASRLFERDHTLWADDPTEISNRLGWLREPETQTGNVAALQQFAAQVRDSGVAHVVWCGMGGSSLFPELLARSALPGARALTMRVLDTSHPAAIARAADEAAARSSLYVFASKSGGTIETRSQLEYFWHRVGEPSRFAVVTDANSSLDALATQRGYRAVFHANSEIGGRYSALSHFGLVAAALLDVDLGALLHGATEMAQRCSVDSAENPALQLGALMGGGARDGRDKLIVDCDAGFAAWLEQLIAESTGKHGRGIVPVAGSADDAHGPDRLRVSYGRGGELDLGADEPVSAATALGAEVFRWEAATALSAVLLRLNPFDQPDVEAAKAAAARSLEHGAPPIATVPLEAALAAAGPGSYVAIQAFCDPGGAVAQQLEHIRVAVREATGAVVTAALGPRYLHSTGQLHKGGPPSGVFVQVLDDSTDDVAVPGGASFGSLLAAQAAGDFAALADRGRPVARVDPGALLTLS